MPLPDSGPVRHASRLRPPRGATRLALTATLLGLWSAAFRAAGAQAAAPVDLERSARVIMAAAKYAVFVTLDSTGHPQTRTVQPVDPDSFMVVRFATNPRSRKVGEVERDARASLHYFDPGSLAYVTLYGRARLIRSAAEKSRYWNPAWTPYYSDRDTSVVLIEVTPERLELVDIKRQISGDPLTWRPPTLQLPARGRPPR